MVRSLEPEDWPDVAAIYRDGLATGDASFEMSVPGWDEWDRTRLSAPRLVAVAAGAGVLGWAALSPTSSREAYRGVAEVSVYVAERARGRGVGGLLLASLVDGAERAGLWTLQASIFPENAASLAIHAAAGFRRVGVRERIAVRDAAGGTSS